MSEQDTCTISNYIDMARYVMDLVDIGFMLFRDSKCLYANKTALEFIKKDDFKNNNIRTLFDALLKEDVNKIINALHEKNGNKVFIRAPKASRDNVLSIGFRIIECKDGLLDELTIEEVIPNKILENFPSEGLTPWQIMMDFIHQPAVLLGMDMKLIAVNRTSAQFLGAADPQEIIGADIQDIIIKDDIEKLKRRAEELSKDVIGSGVGRYHAIRKDGTIIPVEIATSVIRDKENRPVAFLALARDVTEDEKARIELVKREQQLRNIFNTYPQPAYMLEKQGDRIILVTTNNKIRELTEGDITKYIGRPLEELFPEDSGIPSLVQSVMETGIQQQKESLFIHRDSGRHINIIASCAKADKDLVILITTDISAIRKSQEQVRKSEREKTIILGSLSEQVIYFTGPDLKIAWANRAAAEDVGLSEEEVIGERCYELWTNRDEPCVGCPVLEVYRTKQRYKGEMTGSRNRIFQVIVSPILDEKENITGVVEVARDVTEERVALRLLEEARQNLQLLNDLLTHDLNNIYQGVLIGLELLRESTEQSPTASEQLEIIMSQIERSIELIRKVQKLNQIDRVPKDLRSVHVIAIIDKVVEAIKQDFPDRTVKLDVKRPRVCPTVKGDEFLFDAIFNLVHNAVKFSDDEPVRVDIKITHMTSQQQVEIIIDDFGPGIDEATKAILFKERVLGAKGGSGIGLTLVKRIIERYGGHVSVGDRIEGKWEKGSRFKLVLPTA
ncbi:MAG: PAS domain-containing protein [Candidatus Thorarchaeota archaeon]|nr:PAS domain-containing protein [Candidatus Thorarchaeota archaeon]